MFFEMLQKCWEFGNTPLWGRSYPRTVQRAKRKATMEEEKPQFINFTLDGRLARGSGTTYSVDGTDIEINDGTWVFGDLKVGAAVRVTGATGYHGVRLATKIVVR